MKKIFIDGSAGTTGLWLQDRLSKRKDLKCIVLPDEIHKDLAARKRAINSSDIAILCLPDAAARESVALVENPNTVIIDASTAHRTARGWVYGFPELAGRRSRIAKAKRIANPGCHASGFIALIEPLVRSGLLSRSIGLAATSLTGFSGGGKKMIEDYRTSSSPLLHGGRHYALAQNHKHLPEIQKVCKLEMTPVFMPIVMPDYSGMVVTIPIFAKDIQGSVEDVRNAYRKTYSKGGMVSFVEDPSDGGFLSSSKLSGRDSMEVSVCGNEDRILLVSCFDNLGKGAAGAAIQNMNIVLGVAEDEGLRR